MKKTAKECGRRIKQWREDAGLTQEELAERVHFSKITINKLENGHISRPKKELIENIAKELGVIKEFLSGETDYPDLDYFSMGDTWITDEQAAGINDFLAAFGYKMLPFRIHSATPPKLYDFHIMQCPDGEQRAYSLSTIVNATRAFYAILNGDMLPLSAIPKDILEKAERDD